MHRIGRRCSLVARLAADISTGARVDFSWGNAAGVERQRMTGIPIPVDAGNVICQQSIIWGKGLTDGHHDRAAPCGG